MRSRGYGIGFDRQEHHDRFRNRDRTGLPDRDGDDREDPGVFPYTRGIYPTMYRGRRWTMRQYAGFASAEEINERYRSCSAEGTTGLSVAFDLPTQLGRTPTIPGLRARSGAWASPIRTLDDMRRLFDGIDQTASPPR